MAPPQSSTFQPRLSRYQAARRLWSDVDLKKTPPIPVTRAIAASWFSLSPALVRFAPPGCQGAPARWTSCKTRAMGYDCTLHVVDENALARFVDRFLGRTSEAAPFDGA